MSETVRADESSSKNIYGGPPKVNISLPEISELTQTFKLWKDVQLPIDILLLTVKNCEFLSCYYYINDPFRSYFKGLGYVYFGTFGEDHDGKLKIALMKCSEGCKVPGGALTVVKNAVPQLGPKAVFSVGHCSGMNQKSTKLGDVVLSEKLTTYSYQVTKDEKKFHGSFTTPVSRDIAELIACAGHGWNPPLENPKERKVEVLCGEVLTGTEVMQAEWQREELVKSFPEAIAIETEGEGVFSAAHDLKMEWIVIKGISGYADGTESKENWQTFASVTAASLVVSILKECSIFKDWLHYEEGNQSTRRRTNSPTPTRRRIKSSREQQLSQHSQHLELARTANRRRQSMRLKDPQDLTFELIQEAIPDGFLREDIIMKDRRHLIFATDHQLENLAKAKSWYIDGTFKVVRKPFQQLLSINAFVKSGDCAKQVPMVFVVMSSKKKNDYKEVLKEILNALPTPPAVKQVTLDFEEAMWVALRYVLPKVQLQGCVFHWTQAVRRKIQELELEVLYLRDEGTFKYLRKLMALPFLPSPEISAMFKSLKKDATSPVLRELTRYIENQWVKSLIITPKDWSVYDQPTRTKNDIEGWHHALNIRAIGGHLPFYELIELLHLEAELVDIRIQLVSNQKLAEIQRRANRQLQSKVFGLWEEYKNGESTAAQLLKSMSRLNEPSIAE